MSYARVTVEIEAPVDLVWAVMLDLDSYGDWNPFIYRVDRAPGRAGSSTEVGERFTLRVRLAGRAVASRERVTAVEGPVDGRARLEYQFYGRLHQWGLVRGRRQQTVTGSPGGQSTVYSSEETFRGPLRFLLPLRAVQVGFDRHAAALKARAEQLAAQPT